MVRQKIIFYYKNQITGGGTDTTKWRKAKERRWGEGKVEENQRKGWESMPNLSLDLPVRAKAHTVELFRSTARPLVVVVR